MDCGSGWGIAVFLWEDVFLTGTAGEDNPIFAPSLDFFSENIKASEGKAGWVPWGTILGSWCPGKGGYTGKPALWWVESFEFINEGLELDKKSFNPLLFVESSLSTPTLLPLLITPDEGVCSSVTAVDIFPGWALILLAANDPSVEVGDW